MDTPDGRRCHWQGRCRYVYRACAGIPIWGWNRVAVIRQNPSRAGGWSEDNLVPRRSRDRQASPACRCRATYLPYRPLDEDAEAGLL